MFLNFLSLNPVAALIVLKFVPSGWLAITSRTIQEALFLLATGRFLPFLYILGKGLTDNQWKGNRRIARDLDGFGRNANLAPRNGLVR